MNYDLIIASAIQHWSHAREFQRLFPDAEHTIVEAKRDFSPHGWKPVHEWISRASLYDRYVVWLVAAIEIKADGTITKLEEPELYVVEAIKVVRGRDEEDGPKWESECFSFVEGAWQQLVENGGDFASIEFELTVDAPVDSFAVFWRDTRPHHRPEPPGAIALRAPIKFGGA